MLSGALLLALCIPTTIPTKNRICCFAGGKCRVSSVMMTEDAKFALGF